MKWTLLIGWGIVIYAIVFLAWSLLVIHGIIEGLLPRLLLAAVLISVVYFAAMSLPKKKWRDVVLYSAGWVLIAVFFDLVCAVPVSGWEIWHDWGIWSGYTIVGLAPFIVLWKRRRVKARTL